MQNQSSANQESTKDSHGFEQAKAQAQSIIAMVAAHMLDYDRLEELKDEHTDLVSATQDPESADEEAYAIEALETWEEENKEELDSLMKDAGEYTYRDEAREAIQNDALSVEVRSSWVSSGEELEAEEFRIVLCTGGPHVEIVGELDQYKQPSRARMQYQDWGTPVTQFFDIEQSTLLAYCQCFYFGE